MCTLTYYPHSEGHIITANRDESPLRNSMGLSDFSVADEDFKIAKEPKFGGTNMAIGRFSRTVVLLNGAFEAHTIQAYPGMSRGLLLLETLAYNSIDEFIQDRDLVGIEPFTLVDFGEQPTELRWDGNKTHTREYEVSKPILWASAQLYEQPVLENRQRWYRDFIDDHLKELTPQNLWDFHHNAGSGDKANDMVMNRMNMVRTVSITQIQRFANTEKVKHHDLMNDKLETYNFLG